jgi:hypothetical protein
MLPRGADVARRSIPQEEIGALLEFAAQQDTAAFIRGYVRQFREEFVALRDSSKVRLSGSLSSDYHRTHNLTLAGVGYDTVWTPRATPTDEHDGSAGGRGTLTARYFAAAAAVSSSSLSELQAVIASRRVGLWAGRKDGGYATPYGGGIVLNSARLDGVGVFLTRPLTLPIVGPIRFESQVTQIHNVLLLHQQQFELKPYLLSARGSFDMFRLLRVGINRGIIFGGKGNYPVTFHRLANTLIGVYTSDFDSTRDAFANQMVSVDGRLRIPSHSLPTELYMDWGSDDAAGAYLVVPGIIAGAQFGPFQQHDFAFGVERTQFATNDSLNSDWYQNSWFRGSWADRGVLLGHPLGGNGVEWRGYVTGGWPLRGVTGEASLYTRDRKRQNLLAPKQLGRSVGGTFDADVRINNATRAMLQAEIEHGREAVSWNSYKLRAGLRYRFF